MSGRAMQPEEIAHIIEGLGAVHLSEKGVKLVHRDGGVFLLKGPIVRSFVLEELARPMPNHAVGQAIKLLGDRALDVRSPPASND